MDKTEFKAYRAKMLDIPSKRGDLRAEAAESVESPGFLLTSVERLAGRAPAREIGRGHL